MSQVTIDSTAVKSAVNEIDVNIEDIKTRIRKFLEVIEEKKQATQGKFPVVVTLEKRMQEEVQNLNEINEAMESINEVVQKYIDLASEAVDDSFLQTNN